MADRTAPGDLTPGDPASGDPLPPADGARTLFDVLPGLTDLTRAMADAVVVTDRPRIGHRAGRELVIESVLSRVDDARGHPRRHHQRHA